jgi:small ubiquitin-related modifier
MDPENPLPELKKPVKFTPASLRIMQACEKAFAANNFLLLYFTNSKMFTPQFSQPEFTDALRNRFQFLQLSRADRAGNWLTTTFHVKCSPYFAIIDPSNGQYLEMRYGDVSTPTLQMWLQSFLARGPRFALPESIFPELIKETHSFQKRASFSYGTKIRINFVAEGSDDRVVYVNKVAPLEIAFEKYCSERGLDVDAYYFLYRGIELPPTVSAAQMGIRNGGIIHMHSLEDKVSTEPLSVTVVGLDGGSSLFNVTRGRQLGAFLKSYCEMNGLNPGLLRFTFNGEPVHDDLTFAEHNMKNGDQLFAHHRQHQPNEFVYPMLGAGEVPRMAEQFELPMGGGPNPNMMFYYNQPPRPAPLPPQPFPSAYPGPYPMPPAKNVHYQKQHDPNTTQSIWESFDMPMP